jgi:3-oxoacyl-[acyl-carrier protein] reductase
MKLLEGKTAIITGAGRGIGRAIALAMAAEGAGVAVIYASNDLSAEAVGEEIDKLGSKRVIIKCDVSDSGAVKAAVDEAVSSLGSPDILVNNAGIVRDSLVFTMKEADFDAVVKVNLKGSFNMIKAVMPYFIKKRAGRIINITSVSGICGNAGQANYSAAKAGLIGLTKSVARELGARGITCNALAPGFIETDMTSSLPASIRETAVANIPLKRTGQPEDVASAAVFLASDNASYITGEVLKIDGGMCM